MDVAPCLTAPSPSHTPCTHIHIHVHIHVHIHTHNATHIIHTYTWQAHQVGSLPTLIQGEHTILPLQYRHNVISSQFTWDRCEWDHNTGIEPEPNPDLVYTAPPFVLRSSCFWNICDGGLPIMIETPCIHTAGSHLRVEVRGGLLRALAAQ